MVSIKQSATFVIHKCYTMIKRSYDKVSYKSNPSGIRFNLEHEKIALIRSKKKTRQQLVDFLLENYVKGENPITERHEPLSEKPYIPPPKEIETRRTPTQWVEEKRSIELPELYEAFIDRLNKASYLSEKEKREIKYA